MLNFLDPISVDGLTIFRDDEDSRTMYVLPDLPGVPLDADGLPQFLFLLYLRDASELAATDASGAGYLQFRTVLTLPPDRRQTVTDALRAQLIAEQAAGKKPFGNEITITDPVLAAPLWTAGSVNLATFAVGDTGLVTQATGNAPVDLTGDLGASFVATLSADGAGVFRAAFDAYAQGTHQLPLVITYNLGYAGRISASLTIEAKHSVIHERVWQHATPWQLLDTGFVRYVPLVIDEPFQLELLPGLRQRFGRIFPMIHPEIIAQSIQETISDSSITVTIDEASTGDPAADAANRAALVKLATDLLTESLLPSLTTGPPAPGASDANQAASNTSLLQLDENATPGTATFQLELTDAMSVVRQAAPNAPLQVLIANPSVLSACFQELRLADDFFKEMKVAVSTAGVDFSSDGIAKVHVFYRYNQTDDADPARPMVSRSDDGVLSSATDQLNFRFDTAREANGGHKEGYEYMAEVYWQKGGAPTTVPWTASTSRSLIITPPLLGAIKVDAVLTAPPGSVDSARVDLTYVAADHTTYTGGLELTPSVPRGSWLQSTGEILTPDQQAQQPSYSYAITYRRGPVSIAMPAVTSASDTVEVPTPFTGSVTFNLMAQGDFTTMTAIAGTLSYADPAHGYTMVEPFTLNAGAQSARIDVPVLAGGPRTASFTARIEHADGTHTDLPAGTVAEGLTFVGADPTAAFTVQLRTDLIDFVHDVKAIHVTLRYTDADGTISTAEPVFTVTDAATFTWSVPRQSGDPASYDADVTFYGIDRSTDQTLHLTGQTSTNVELDRAMATS